MHFNEQQSLPKDSNKEQSSLLISWDPCLLSWWKSSRWECACLHTQVSWARIHIYWILPINVQEEQTPQKRFLSLNHCPGIGTVYQVSRTLMCSTSGKPTVGKDRFGWLEDSPSLPRPRTTWLFSTWAAWHIADRGAASHHLNRDGRTNPW